MAQPSPPAEDTHQCSADGGGHADNRAPSESRFANINFRDAFRPRRPPIGARMSLEDALRDPKKGQRGDHQNLPPPDPEERFLTNAIIDTVSVLY
ncbi:hypothetical protein LSM04_007692 [Trypanosoma melophagium]|uniref:uncharacterized protein n=1 Tax=Trypanosoma melophagium TaxID=715481 RepID=UPI00351A00A0|nr:hypothetical protein LSM04_007692 [Trypanosoma melophagium]